MAEIRNRLAIGPLVKSLTDGNPNVRVAVAEALGKIGDESAIPALEQLSADMAKTTSGHPRTVRDVAATAIRKIKSTKKPAPATQPAASAQPAVDLDALVEVLKAKVGGTWEKDLRNAFSPAQRIVRGRIYSAPGKVKVAYDVFPFSPQALRSGRWRSALIDAGRVVGVTDRLTVVVSMRDPAADVSAEDGKIIRALGLAPWQASSRPASTSAPAGRVSQANWGKAVDGLEVSIIVEGKVFDADRPIPVRRAIRNVDKEDRAILWHDLHYSPVLFDITDANGKVYPNREDLRRRTIVRRPAQALGRAFG